jgi:hypothetical protein
MTWFTHGSGLVTCYWWVLLPVLAISTIFMAGLELPIYRQSLFSCRIRIWSQNSNIPPAPCVITSFAIRHVIKDWLQCQELIIKYWHCIQRCIWHLQQFLALFCTCTHQHMEFWGKLFWALLYTYNVMCSRYCMMILTRVFMWNGWYNVKIHKLHHCVSIISNA